jgi:hypothetical protein
VITGTTVVFMPGRVEIVRAVVPYYFQSPYSSGISSARESAIQVLGQAHKAFMAAGVALPPTLREKA